MKVRKALTIAGSDSGGGAGIQADLKTFASLGVYGSSVITAITVQNTLGVHDSGGIAKSLVQGQLDAVWNDIGTDAVKTGMLYDAETTELIADRLLYHKIPRLVVDPVMVSTSGNTLLNRSGVKVLREKLLPLADFVTPNIDEAEVLCGFSLQTNRDIHKAAREIHRLGASFVVITGLQRDFQAVDLAYDGREFKELTGAFIKTQTTHGTGCSFSAALTAFLARGFSPWPALARAKKYVNAGLRYGYRVGNGKSPLNHFSCFFPGCVDEPDILELKYAAFHDWGQKPRLQTPLLNVIIGGPLCRGKDYAELTRMAVQNGAMLVQLREKEGETRSLVDTAAKMCRVCHEYGALFVVNDRVDIAAASGADGVHIGQEDLSPQMARALLGPERIIGVSAADMSEAEAAVEAGADYLGVGPVYPTVSKDCKIEACPPGLLQAIAANLPVPVIAIGGITPQNLEPILEAGAAGVAVISSILGADHPARMIGEFMARIKG